jgi:hypothetical protein
MKTNLYWLFIGLVAIGTPGSLFGAASRPDLKGRVTHEDGSVISKATVFIYTAGPKEGDGIVCPSCYPDCTKKTQTGPDGRFEILSLDPALIFRVLVVAGGHESKFVPKVDPAKGELAVNLKPLDAAVLNSRSRISGMVVDEAGEPVAGAVIGPEGVQRGQGTQWGGTDEFVDPVAVSDEKGFFLLPCKENVEKVYAMAEARGSAKRWVTLTPGKDHIIRLQDGVTVRGRLMEGGNPVKDAVMAMVTTDRTCGMFLHDFEAVTDKDGFFLILNVTPQNEYYLYAKMASLRAHGTLPVKAVRTAATGSRVDLGDLKVSPAYRVAGRVVLSDGKTVPGGTRLLLGREKAWDHDEVILDKDGGFVISGVPAESVSISLRVKGYKFSKQNPSLDWLNGGIMGTVDKNINDLILLLEPGEWRYSGREEEDLPAGADRQPRDKPLKGVAMK